MVSTCRICKRCADRYPNLTFHRFPDGDIEKEKWFSSMGIKPFKLSKTSLLCSMHFTEDCFRTTVVSEKLLLKRGSVPSISALQAIQKQPVVSPVQCFGNSIQRYVAPMVFNITIKSEPTITQVAQSTNSIDGKSSNNAETVYIKTEVPDNFDSQVSIKQEPIDANLMYETNTHQGSEIETNSQYIKQEHIDVKLEPEASCDDMSIGGHEGQLIEQFEYVNTDVKLETEYDSSVDNFVTDSQDCLFINSSNSKTSDKICENTGEKPYCCDACSKCFTNTSDLDNHKLLHVGEKLHQCDTCEKTFSHLCNLREHRRVHTGEKPYQCDVCEKCFSRFNNLKRHKQVHTSDKPYKRN